MRENVFYRFRPRREHVPTDGRQPVGVVAVPTGEDELRDTPYVGRRAAARLRGPGAARKGVRPVEKSAYSKKTVGKSPSVYFYIGYNFILIFPHKPIPRFRIV